MIGDWLVDAEVEGKSEVDLVARWAELIFRRCRGGEGHFHNGVKGTVIGENVSDGSTGASFELRSGFWFKERAEYIWSAKVSGADAKARGPAIELEELPHERLI
jgi:hypothetical protein